MLQSTLHKKLIRAKWAKLSAEGRKVSDRNNQLICDAIRNNDDFSSARRIGLYVARPFEIDLKSIWELRPNDCVFPKVNPVKRTMQYFTIKKWEDLTEGFKGILEPKATKARAILDWDERDLILVPGVMFDIYGGRVGSGLGYYDRFLGAIDKSPKKWGVCVARQISKTRLEQEETDVRMDALITELGWVAAKD